MTEYQHIHSVQSNGKNVLVTDFHTGQTIGRAWWTEETSYDLAHWEIRRHTYRGRIERLSPNRYGINAGSQVAAYISATHEEIKS